jgi:hypothetical protein
MIQILLFLFGLGTASTFLVFLFPKIGKDKSGVIPERKDIGHVLLFMIIITCGLIIYNNLNPPIPDETKSTDLNSANTSEDEQPKNPTQENAPKYKYKGEQYSDNDLNNAESSIQSIMAITKQIDALTEKNKSEMAKAMKENDSISFALTIKAFSVRAKELFEDSQLIHHADLDNKKANDALDKAIEALKDYALSAHMEANSLMDTLTGDKSSERLSEELSVLNAQAQKASLDLVIHITNVYYEYGYSPLAMDQNTFRLKNNAKRTVLVNGSDDYSKPVTLPQSEQEGQVVKDFRCLDENRCFTQNNFDKYILNNDKQIAGFKYKAPKEYKDDPDENTQRKIDLHYGLYFAKQIKLATNQTLFDFMNQCGKGIKTDDVSATLTVESADAATPIFWMNYTIHLKQVDTGKPFDIDMILIRSGEQLKAQSEGSGGDMLHNPDFMYDRGLRCWKKA